MASALLRGADPLATNDGVLPTDVLREILLRVPAKELCRLRLVCRSWRSLTSDPRFATAHSARHPMFVGVLPDTGLDEIHLVDLHSGSVVKRIRGPKGLCSHLSTQAGLVCVSAEPIDRAAQDLVLNPATGAVSALPVGDRPSMVLACVLGHVPSTGEYKVVRVGNQVEERMKTVFQVVALGGGEQRWRTKPSPVDIITDSRFIAVVSGVAYFMATYDDDEHDDDSGSDMGPELVLLSGFSNIVADEERGGWSGVDGGEEEDMEERERRRREKREI
ncbi:hypothetical protein HU200_051783 [Digitaria exilis]|uniref:F-box domain-containing protein n=1 Tax=Digitaria exilis TaxID=1010633 RepID=A0A835ATU6_9POAL|nr:hypothetical protein HU200_051783 [Digitaria exilis]